MPDIDIDFADRQKILDEMSHTKASIIDSKGTKSHNTGVYFTECPAIPETNQSSIDYKVLESLGYFKLDLLNVNIYSQVKPASWNTYYSIGFIQLPVQEKDRAGKVFQPPHNHSKAEQCDQGIQASRLKFLTLFGAELSFPLVEGSHSQHVHQQKQRNGSARVKTEQLIKQRQSLLRSAA